MTTSDRATRGPRSAPGLAALGLVGLAVVLTALVVRSPLFELRAVRVEGNVRMSAQDVIGLAGVEVGSNLLLVSPGAVERSVGSSPWVDTVEVRRDLPSTLVIGVRERRPVGWVGDRAGGALLAADGTVLGRRRSARGLVSLGAVEGTLEPGDRLDLGGPRLGVVASLPGWLRREISHAVLRGDRIVLRLRSGGRIIYGPADLLPEKRAALESLLRWAGERDIRVEYIDVRAPKTPALRPSP